MEYLLHILVITGIYIILTLSLNLILGYTGLPAFGHPAFDFGVIVYLVAKNWVSLTKGPLSGGSEKKCLPRNILCRLGEEITNETDDFLFFCQPSHKRRNGLPLFPFLL